VSLRSHLNGLGWLITASIAAACILTADAACAADYVKVGSDTITVTGEIQLGDEVKFRAAVSEIDRSDLKQGGVIMLLDTPGGNVFAAKQIAAGILSARSKGIPTTVVVPAGSVCASSCVVIFAAATHRTVEIGGTKDGVRVPSAALYVHTVSLNDHETTETMAASVDLARLMKEIGTPDSVLAKLVLTGSRDGARLDAKDLRDWKNTTIMPFEGFNR